MNISFVIRNKRLSIALMLIISGIFLKAQAQQVTVAGIVKDKNTKETMPGVTVFCEADKTGAYTDDDGKYEMKVTRRDTVRIVFKLEGYDDYTLEIIPKPGKSSFEGNILLSEPIKESSIGGVVITAGKYEQDLAKVPQSMTTIKPQAIDIQASNDIQKVLEQTPGFTIKDDQPDIRGSSGYAYGVGSRVMVMLDGLPLLSADAAFPQFDMIPTDNIAQIEIMKGASSVLYGSGALGGVINVITSDPGNKPRTSIRLKSTIFDAPANPKLDWDGTSSAYIASAHIFHSRKIGQNFNLTILQDLVKDSGYRKGTDTEQARWMVMTKYSPKNVPGLSFGANASYKVDSSGTFLFWGGYEPDSATRTYNFTTLAGTSGSPVTDTVFVGGALTAMPGTERMQKNERIGLDPFVKYLTEKGNLHSYKGRLLVNKNINNTGQSFTGYLYYNDYQFMRTIWKNKVNFTAGANYTYSFADGDSLYGGDHYAHSGALYAQLDGRFLGEPGEEKLNVSLGGRYEYITFDGEYTVNAPIFRAGLNFEPRRGTNFRTSFGQAFRAPSMAERYTTTSAGGLVISPNPELRPEYGYSAELGARQEFFVGDKNTGRFMLGFLDVAAFTMNFKDMIEFGFQDANVQVVPDIVIEPIFSAINLSNARINGLEITGFASAHLGKWNFGLNGGITLIDPQNLKATEPDSLLQFDPLDEDFNLFDALNDLAVYEDNPEFLKYRSKTMYKATVSVGYDKWLLTCNYRNQSHMINVDQFLLVAVPGTAEFRNKHPNGYQVFDFILGYNFAPGSTISLHADNAFNEEYIIIPGLMAEQRRFTLQYKYVF